jgi:polysaccharide biosynthesis/export protein
MKLLIALFIAGLCITHASAQTLRSGDSLSITVLQDPKLDRTVLVDPKGEIALPLAGHIRARGLTPEAVENILRARLKDNYKDGRVDVTVALAGTAPREAPEDDLKPRVFLTGEVLRPGSYVVRQRTTLMQAIALAGGLSPFAAKARIQVRRRAPGGEEVFPFNYRAYEAGGDIEGNIYLRTGDVILIPERGILGILD